MYTILTPLSDIRRIQRRQGIEKEVKKRYSSKNLQKRLSKHNDVNAVIESSVHPKFCFSQSNILTATTHIAHCVSADFSGQKLSFCDSLLLSRASRIEKITIE